MIVHHMKDGTVRETMEGVTLPKEMRAAYRLAEIIREGNHENHKRTEPAAAVR